MERKITYELTMSARLEHVPLPDVEDVVWCHIEMMLDAEANLRRAKTAHSGKVFFKRIIVWSAALALAAIMIVIVRLHLRIDQSVPENVQVTLPARNANLERKDTLERVPPNLSDVEATTSHAKPSMSIDRKLFKFSPVPVDTTGDTLANILYQHLPDRHFPSPKDSFPVSKKPLGVKGITDDDYRMTSVADSIK